MSVRTICMPILPRSVRRRDDGAVTTSLIKAVARLDLRFSLVSLSW